MNMLKTKPSAHTFLTTNTTIKLLPSTVKNNSKTIMLPNIDKNHFVSKIGEGFSKDFQTTHKEAANAVVSFIMVTMLGFFLFMTIFFWKKYKQFSVTPPTYQYSRLSQNEVEAEEREIDSDLTVILDQLGLVDSTGNSSSEDENEPATLPLSSIDQFTVPTVVSNGYAVPTAIINGNAKSYSSDVLGDSDEELLQ